MEPRWRRVVPQGQQIDEGKAPERVEWAQGSEESEVTHNIAKIRAALESIRSCDDVEGERDAALAALAELEKAAAEPVAWVIGKPTHGHEIGRYLAWNAGHVPHSVGSAAEPLYAAPPAPVAEIREPTPEECERIDSVYASLDRTSHGRAMFNAVRNVMWPKEGL